MTKCFALIRMEGDMPDLPPQALGLVNSTLCDPIPVTNWGAYLVAATGPNLLALDESWSGFIGIVAVTEAGDVRWGELENPCDSTVRDRLNTWLAARDLPTIPEDWTNRQIVHAIFERANNRFDLAAIDIVDV